MNDENELLNTVRRAKDPTLATEIALEIIRRFLLRPLSFQGQAGDCPPEYGEIHQ